jgi:hypothetical protein
VVVLFGEVDSGGLELLHARGGFLFEFLYPLDLATVFELVQFFELADEVLVVLLPATLLLCSLDFGLQQIVLRHPPLSYE